MVALATTVNYTSVPLDAYLGYFETWPVVSSPLRTLRREVCGDVTKMCDGSNWHDFNKSLIVSLVRTPRITS